MTHTVSKFTLCALALLFLFAGPASPFLLGILSLITIFCVKPAFRSLNKMLPSKPMLTDRRSGSQMHLEAYTNGDALSRANELKRRISKARLI